MKDIIFYGATGLSIPIAPKTLLILAIIVLSITIVLYLLRSFAIYTMAKKQKFDKLYLAFIPVFWVLPVVKLAKVKSIIGKKTNNVGVILLSVYLTATILSLAVDVISYLPIIGYYFQGGEIMFSVYEEISSGWNKYTMLSGIYTSSSFLNPYLGNMAWMGDLNTILGLVANFVDLFSLIMFISIYINLFRRYSPKSSFGLTFFSILGLFGIMAFIVRNREPINFEEYMRSRYAGMYNGQRPNPNGQNPYGNGQGQNNTNSNANNTDPFGYDEINKQRQQKREDNPFPEFDDKDKR